MKIKFQMTVPERTMQSSGSRVGIRQLLRDALADFIGERMPPENFVAMWYPDGYLGDHAKDAAKIKEVTDRLRVAGALEASLDLVNIEGCDANDDCPGCPHQDDCDDPAAELYRDEMWQDGGAGFLSEPVVRATTEALAEKYRRRREEA